MDLFDSILVETPEGRHAGAIALAILWSGYMQTAATLIASGTKEEEVHQITVGLLAEAQQRHPWESIPEFFPGLASIPPPEGSSASTSRDS